jgi:2'-5' RNA ligase
MPLSEQDSRGQDGTIRVFLGLPLAEHFGQDLQEVLAMLRRHISHGVTWVKVENIHITLHFFGSIRPEELPNIVAAVTPVAHQFLPLSLGLQAVGGFPNLGRPRVLWVGLHGDLAMLQDLQRQVLANLTQAGFATEERPFQPHATVGRVKRPLEATQLRAAVRAINLAGTRQPLACLNLYRSHLSPTGPRYEVLRSFTNAP